MSKGLDCVGEYTGRLCRTLDYKKPAWMVLQAYQWHEEGGRFPTQRELRFMTYDAIIHGATGIIYFNYHRRETSPPAYN